MTESQLFTIIHLSDLHLYVDPDLTSTDPRLLAQARRRWLRSVWRVKRAGRLVKMDKLEVADPRAVEWLEAALAGIAEGAVKSQMDQGATLLVVHTGDVETVGPRPGPGGTVSYPGYDYLHTSLRADALGGAEWIDVYGNHDVWGGTWPLFERLAGGDTHTDNFETIRQVAGLESYAEPVRIESPTGLATLVVHRVNTVDPDIVGASLAWGRVGSHPIGEAQGEACSRLGDAVAANTESATVQIAAMHHPPHPFPHGWWFQRWFAEHLGSSRLAGANQLADVVNGKVRLVLAGHHHRTNPLETAACPVTQPPLRRGATVQLAAPSPTATKHLAHLNADEVADQARALDAIESRAFPVYTVSVTDEHPPRLLVDRVMHRQLPDSHPTGGVFGSRASRTTSPQRVLDVRLE